MANKLPLVYWDTCIVIDAIRKDPTRIEAGENEARYPKIKEVVDLAEQGQLLIMISTLTMAGVYKIKRNDPSSALDPKDEQDISDFFEHSWIIRKAVDSSIATKARGFSQKYGLYPNDAVHLATALFWNADVMHTFDKSDLIKLNGIVGDPPLLICRPCDPIAQKSGQANLLDGLK